MNPVTIDVVSDVVCPWCFIGKRHLDQALAQWHKERPDSQVEIRWHPYFLNPDTPEAGEPYRPFLERKFGGPEKLAEIWARVGAAGKGAGIDFAFEKIELRGNTLNAHRLIHRAQKLGGNPVNGLVDALFSAQFLEGRHLGDREVLADIAAACGEDRDEIRRYLASSEDIAEVKAKAMEAPRMGISGVPFFIFDHRLAASGAQPPEALLQGLRQAADAAAPAA